MNSISFMISRLGKVIMKASEHNFPAAWVQWLQSLPLLQHDPGHSLKHCPLWSSKHRTFSLPVSSIHVSWSILSFQRMKRCYSQPICKIQDLFSIAFQLEMEVFSALDGQLSTAPWIFWSLLIICLVKFRFWNFHYQTFGLVQVSVNQLH